MAGTSTTGGSKAKVSPRLIGGVLIFAAALWFILANTESTRIRVWLVTVSSPVWLVLTVTFLAGGACGMLYSGRRRKNDQDKQQQR